MAKPKQTRTKTQKWLIGIGIFVGVYIVSTFLPFVSSYTRYPIYFVKCGGQPIVGSTFMGSRIYYMPQSDDYRIGILHNYYFCSEQEAQAAGFRKE